MNDLISRQAAIDAINQICPIDTEYDCTLLDRVDVRCVLTDLPSAQPEPIKVSVDREMTEEELKELIADSPVVLLPSAQPETCEGCKHLGKWENEVAQKWIPCSERLPEDIRPVIVTWKNNDPASYYQYIVGKHFTGAACYKNDKWYWYSSTTEDMLAEYGRYDSEEFDEAIECIAWMPLPEPYKEGAEEENDYVFW